MPRKDSATDSVAPEIARPEASLPRREGGAITPRSGGYVDARSLARSLAENNLLLKAANSITSWNVLAEVMTFSGCVAAATRLRHQMMPIWLRFSVEGGTLASVGGVAVVVVIVIVVKGYDASSVGHRGRNRSPRRVTAESAAGAISLRGFSIIHHWRDTRRRSTLRRVAYHRGSTSFFFPYNRNTPRNTCVRRVSTRPRPRLQSAIKDKN